MDFNKQRFVLSTSEQTCFFNLFNVKQGHGSTPVFSPPSMFWKNGTYSKGRLLTPPTISEESDEIQADSYGNKKLIRKWTKPVFLFGTKNLVRVKLMATVFFRHDFDY